MLGFASTAPRMVQEYNSLEAIELGVFVELAIRHRMLDGIPKVKRRGLAERRSNRQKAKYGRQYGNPNGVK